MTTLAACLHAHSQRSAIILSGNEPKVISHSSLANNVFHIQQVLEARQIKGKTVAIVVANPHLFTVVFLSTVLQSCTAAPLNHNFKGREFEYYYQDLKADLVVLVDRDIEKSSAAYVAAQSLKIPVATIASGGGQTATLKFVSDESIAIDGLEEERAELDPSTSALILHTSGTTGKPKAVMLSHHNLISSARNIAEHYNISSPDVAPVIMPLFHIHGIVAGLLTPLLAESAVIFPPPPTSGLTPSFLSDAAAHGATWYTATPTLHRLVLKLPLRHGDKAPAFRFVRSCSSALDGSLQQKLEERFGCPVVEAYAMTEAAHQVTSNPVDKRKLKVGSVGIATGTKLTILDETENKKSTDVGEVCICGENVMSGYLDNEEANNKSFVQVDGETWFRTGDQGKIDGDGYLTLTGRLKEMINKGGEKVSPVEIDSISLEHEAVAEAVAFAMPDEMYGEEVGLAIVLAEGQHVEERVLKKWIGERLAQTKVPKKVFFLEAIPKTAVGKVQRNLVAKTLLPTLDALR